MLARAERNQAAASCLGFRVPSGTQRSGVIGRERDAAFGVGRAGRRASPEGRHERLLRGSGRDPADGQQRLSGRARTCSGDLLGQRQLDADHGAAARCGRELEAAAEFGRALAHRGEPDAGVPVVGQTAAVVGDLEAQSRLSR